MEIKEKNFYNVPECARFFECSEKTIRRLIEEKKLLAHDIGAGNRRVYRIPVEELERFLEKTANLKRKKTLRVGKAENKA